MAIVTAGALLCAACGSSRANSAASAPPGTPAGPTKPGDPISVPNIPGVVPPASPVDASCANVMSGPYTASLPVPDQVTVVGDDYNARVQWGGALTGDNTNPTGVEGYRVCWGPQGSAPSYGTLTTNRIAQLVGVQNGAQFTAYVQSVDGLGNVSAPSAAVNFTGDPTRVAKMRGWMSAFFDDFNATSTQPIDELRWNTAFSACNDASVNGSYINDMHAVNLIGNHSFLPGSILGCDRDQNIVRAREIFDFTGREGVISFDLDGADGNRSTWYVDVFPYEGKPTDEIDITGHVTFDPGGGHPGRFLRFSQGGNVFEINRFDAAGNPLQIYKGDISYTQPNIQYIPGVQRHWELRVAQDHASITIDGQPVLAAPGLGLDFQKGIVTWDLFNYNPQKIGRPWVQISFDNFGFDGPKSAPVVHNYKVSTTNDATPLGYANPPDYGMDRTVTIPIPDDLSQANNARFFYTIQNNSYQWKPEDSYTINGQSFPIAEPTSPTGLTVATDLVDGFRAFCKVDPIPMGVLQQGNNAIALHADQSLLINLHIEVDSGSAAFTQPAGMLPQPLVPATPLIGPTMVVGRINTTIDNLYDTGAFRINTTNVSGTATIALKIDNLRPVFGSSRNLGVSKAELVIDQQVFATLQTNAVSPAPASSDLAFTVDTTKLTNGTHEVFGVAYDAAGTKGRPGYPDPEKNENGVDPTAYAPILINVAN